MLITFPGKWIIFLLGLSQYINYPGNLSNYLLLQTETLTNMLAFKIETLTNLLAFIIETFYLCKYDKQKRNITDNSRPENIGV